MHGCIGKWLAQTLATAIVFGTPAIGLGQQSQPAMAGGCKEECSGTPTCCGHCGCQAPCKRMCTVVPDVKEVTKVVWEERKRS